MSKEPKYEAAFAELQSIVTKMENDELDIDQLSKLLKSKFSAKNVVNVARNVYFCKQN